MQLKTDLFHTQHIVNTVQLKPKYTQLKGMLQGASLLLNKAGSVWLFFPSTTTSAHR